MKRFSALVISVAALFASSAAAMSIQFANGVPSTATSSIAACNNPLYGQNYTGCTTNAFISPNVATSTDYFMNLDSFGGGGQSLGEESFTSAFALSNTGYTLQQSSDTLSGITLTVTQFGAGSYANVGGIGGQPPALSVSVSGTLGAGDPTANQLVWIQGLEINYQPGLPGNNSYDTSQNFNTLDDASFNNLTTGCTAIPASPNATTPSNVPGSPAGGNYCDPIYPFQYNNNSFFDAPLGPWPNGSFRGIALLATINTVSDVITTYGGISYGFDNSVAPEPATWMLILCGACMVALSRSVRRGKNQA